MADGPGLTTFVGRVRGELASDDAEWVEATSDSIETLREQLVDAADRLGRIEQALPADTPHAESGAVADTPSSETADELTAWERLVDWATEVNAALVEMAGRRRLPGSFDVTATAAIAGEQAAHALADRAGELGALLQSVRGEQVVDELLAAGVLVAPPGTTGSVAFAEHGAWDVEFLGPGGATIARADVAVTSDAAEVLGHLATRPGVNVVYTTSDAADGLVHADGVAVVRPGGSWPLDHDGVVAVDIGTDSGALHTEVADALGGVGAASSTDALLEAVPVLALLIVGGRAGARAVTTTDTAGDILTATWRQTKDVVTTAGVSELASWASGMNLIKVPTTLTFSLGRAAVRDARSSVELSARRISRARRLMTEVQRIGNAG